MMRLHQGWDYRLYKLYIWGGLTFIVLQILVSALAFDALELPDPQPFLVLAGPLLLWIAGILLYWWWVFLFKGDRELEALRQAPTQGVPDISKLRSWSTLHEAMTAHGGNVDELIKNAKRARRPMLVWYGGLNLMACWVVCPVALGSLGVIQRDGVGIWLAGVFVWIAVMLVGTPFLLSWRGRRSENAYLAPLGLAMTLTPRLEAEAVEQIAGGQEPIPDAPAIFEGARHGRLIHIETVGKHSLTVLKAKVLEFRVGSNDGKLVPGKGTPEPAARALKRLRKAKRWRGIVVHAGPEGIGIQRRSRGTNMWLYDLWLAEYLCYESNGPITKREI